MNEVISELRVRYVETDKMGIVHHSVYLHWMEIGRAEYLRNCGLSYREMEKKGIRIVVVEAFCKYLSKALYDDLIIVKTKLSESSRISFTFEYEILRKCDKKLLAKGYTKHIATDSNNKPKRVSSEILSIIRRLS